MITGVITGAWNGISSFLSGIMSVWFIYFIRLERRTLPELEWVYEAELLAIQTAADYSSIQP